MALGPIMIKVLKVKEKFEEVSFNHIFQGIQYKSKPPIKRSSFFTGMAFERAGVQGGCSHIRDSEVSFLISVLI